MKVKVVNEIGEVVLDLKQTPTQKQKEDMLRLKKPNHFVLISCLKLNNSDYEFVNSDYYLLKDSFDYLLEMSKVNLNLDVSVSFYPTLKQALGAQLIMHNQF